MIYCTLCIYSHVSKRIIKNLFLSLEMCHYVPVKLCFQLKSDSFNVGYVIPNLRLTVLLATLLAWFCNEIFKYQLRLLLCSPSDSAIVRSYEIIVCQYLLHLFHILYCSCTLHSLVYLSDII